MTHLSSGSHSRVLRLAVNSILLPAFFVLTASSSYAQTRPNQQTENQDTTQQRENRPNRESNDMSPVRGIDRSTPRPRPIEVGTETRTLDGSNNNLVRTEMGAAHIQLVRIADADYADGISEVAGEGRPSARAISNQVFKQTSSLPNNRNASDFLWQWGQFLDHDIDLTVGTNPREDTQIPVPTGDVFFDPDNTGIESMVINRSLYDEETGTSKANPRQQINEITAWIDASNVYGSDLTRSNALRTLDGSGKLKVSSGNLLPFNEAGLANAGGSGATLFLAGDVRANEQVGLTVMHTLFMREHNRLAERIAQDSPSLSGEEIFQQTKRLVAAQMQAITYREFLPLLLGRDGISRYRGYNPRIDASIKNEFSTAAYRFGHTLLSPVLLRLDNQGNTIEQGNLALRDAFFRPDRLIREGGIEPVLRGLASQVCQSIDSYVIDDIRNFLFGEPGNGGFDLAAVNIQRGRDHGLASYNDTRRALGLRPHRTFNQISSDPEVQQKLAAAYDSVEDIDLWVGGLAEDAHRNAMVGEVFFQILKRQFEALRDGDRFWYQRNLSNTAVRRIEQTRLSDIIRRNTDIEGEIPDNVFMVN